MIVFLFVCVQWKKIYVYALSQDGPGENIGIPLTCFRYAASRPGQDKFVVPLLCLIIALDNFPILGSDVP